MNNKFDEFIFDHGPEPNSFEIAVTASYVISVGLTSFVSTIKIMTCHDFPFCLIFGPFLFMSIAGSYVYLSFFFFIFCDWCTKLVQEEDE